jgi:hypothetical protein
MEWGKTMGLFDGVLTFKNTALWKGIGVGVAACFLLMAALAVSIPNLMRSKMSAREAAFVGGGAGYTPENSIAQRSSEPDTVQANGPKIIHKAELDLRVANCAETLKKIEALAAVESGFLESSTLGENAAKITLRVPSARFDAVRGKLRDLALRVRQDSVTAADVTKQYFDREARLRNLRAEEQQFLDVMKRAHTVPDVLAVTKQLAETRGEIEIADAEFRHLRDQIDMAEIDVQLSSEVSDSAHWALGASVKSAFNDLLQSLSSFGDFVIWLVVNLPLMALWTVTIFFLAVVCWYVLRKAARIMRGIFGKTAATP